MGLGWVEYPGGVSYSSLYSANKLNSVDRCIGRGVKNHLNEQPSLTLKYEQSSPVQLIKWQQRQSQFGASCDRLEIQVVRGIGL